jgi:dihydrofolate reductase
MQGGTSFHFVDGFDAGDLPIDVAGGASAVRQALQARCLDELVLDIVPVLLGNGERTFDNVATCTRSPSRRPHSRAPPTTSTESPVVPMHSRAARRATTT